jgi:hypothetical protein
VVLTFTDDAQEIANGVISQLQTHTRRLQW